MIFVPMAVDSNAHQCGDQKRATKHTQNNVKVNNVLIRYFHRTSILSF